MANYRIFFRKSVKKDLKQIPKKDLKAILQKIALLANNPRPLGHEKLSGKGQYRLRQGHYRILYSIHDQVLEIWVVKVGHRKEIYR